MGYRNTAYRDEAHIEGSDQWLVMQQLVHGQLRIGDVAELVDCGLSKAMRILYSLRSFDHIRHAGGGFWELMPKSGTRLQT